MQATAQCSRLMQWPTAVLSKKEANTTAQDTGRGSKFRQMKAEQAAKRAANTAGQVQLQCQLHAAASAAGELCSVLTTAAVRR